jgi:hypothetical protein
MEGHLHLNLVVTKRKRMVLLWLGLGGAAQGLNSPPPPNLEGGSRNSRTGQEFDDSKEAENPARNRGLPSVSTPGAAMEGVNFGGGSQASKDASEGGGIPRPLLRWHDPDPLGGLSPAYLPEILKGRRGGARAALT